MKRKQRNTKLQGLEGKLSKDETIKRLKALATYLEDIPQDKFSDEHRQELKALLPCLVRNTIINNTTASIKLLAACCLADVLRLYAPNAPYSTDELVKVLNLFASQLTGINNPAGASYARHFYLLELLAQVKCLLICMELSDPSAYAEELFKTFLNGVRRDQSSKVPAYMLDIMSSMVEEGITLTDVTLDELFGVMLPKAQRENPAAYDLAASFVQRTSKTLSLSTTHYFNGLLGMETHDHESELKEHVYVLVESLASVDLTVLMRVLPQFQGLFVDEEASCRVNAVKVVGKLFINKPEEMFNNHGSLWHHLLGRFADKSADVRAALVGLAGNLLPSCPTNTREELSQHVLLMLTDQDDQVRAAACQSVLHALTKDFTKVNTALVAATCERRLDKKATVRGAVVEELANVYDACRHRIESTGMDDTSERAKVTMLATSYITTYNCNESDVRLKIEQGVQERLFHSSLEPRVRAERLLDMCLAASDKCWGALGGMLKIKARANVVFADYLKHREEENDEESDMQQKHLFAKMAALLVANKAKAMDTIQRLHTMNNDGIFQDLKQFVSNNACHLDDISSAREKIIKQSNRQTSTILRELLVRIYPFPIDCDTVEQLLALLHEAVDERHDDHCEAGARFLSLFGEHRRSVFLNRSILKSLASLIGCDYETLSAASLKVFASVGSELQETVPGLASKLKKTLVDLSLNGTDEQATMAVSALVSLVGEDEGSSALEQVVVNAKEQLDINNERLSTALKSLAQIALKAPIVFDEHSKFIIVNFAVNELLLKNENPVEIDDDDAEWEDEISQECLARVYAIELLVNRLLGKLNQGVEEDQLATVAKPPLKLMTTCLQSYGQLIDQRNISASDASRLRLACAQGLLTLASKPAFRRMITPARFCILSTTMQDSCVEVRSAFREQLHGYLNQRLLPVSYCAMFVLSAIDPDVSCRKASLQHLRNVVVRRRKLSTLIEKDQNLPEYALPHLVYMLAHHEDFEDSAEALEMFSQYINFFLDCVCQKGEESFEFLMSLVNAMKAMEDANDNDGSSSQAIWTICDLTSAILTQRASAPGWTREQFSGQVALPKALFKRPEHAINVKQSYLPASFALPRYHTEKLKAPAPPAAQAGSQPQSAKKASKGKRPARARDGDDDDDDEPEDDYSPGKVQASSGPRRKSSRATQSQNTSMADLDDEVIAKQSSLEEAQLAQAQKPSNGKAGRRAAKRSKATVEPGSDSDVADNTMDVEVEDAVSSSSPSPEPARKQAKRSSKGKASPKGKKGKKNQGKAAGKRKTPVKRGKANKPADDEDEDVPITRRSRRQIKV
eukprot:m.268532 g.268532  ORF g.268532 m.268532 type:complete len:1316 (+) comp17653_c0_seq2:13-3960(+)